MAGPNLETLLPEMQLAIIEYIPRPTDLKNLCLTSKAIRDIATSRLYRSIEIDLKKCKFPSLNGLFRSGNVGQQSVRELSFRPSWGSLRDPVTALRVVRSAIEMLPQDALTTLKLPDNFKGDLDLLLLLATRQQKIATLRLGGASSSLSDALSSPAFSLGWPRYLRSVNVGGNLRDMPTVRGHVAPFGTVEPLVIQSFHLSGICLKWSDRTFAHIIDFTKLCSLTVWNCNGAGVLLQQLAHKFKRQGCALQKFEFISEGAFPKEEICAFLESWSGLATLKIRGEAVPAKIPDANCLNEHYPTLKVLALDFYDFNGKQIGARKNDINLIALKGHRLHELGVILPNPGLSLSKSAVALEVACPESLIALIMLPNLRLLRFEDWPLAPEGLFECIDLAFEGCAEMQELNTARYLALMDTFATRLVNHIFDIRKEAGLPAFAMLCFGADWVGERGSARSISLAPQCYVPVKETDVYGRDGKRAVRMTKGEMSYVEGVDDLFQWN